MSGGGGKGGGKTTTTETTVPAWIRDPAARNLQRAEAVQQLEYMPYHGGQVAAFNDNQIQAMQNNANAATAFGLLAPTDVMASMPTPTTYANGMKGYGSIGLYDQALAELTASNPENMAAYNSLFGNQVAPINFGRQGGGGGGGFRGGANPTHNPTTPQVHTTSGWKDPAAAAKIMDDLNVTRGKLTDPNMAAYQATQSGEAQARLRHQIQQNYKDQKEGRAKGSMASGKNYRMTYNPKTGRGGF